LRVSGFAPNKQRYKKERERERARDKEKREKREERREKREERETGCLICKSNKVPYFSISVVVVVVVEIWYQSIGLLSLSLPITYLVSIDRSSLPLSSYHVFGINR